MRQLDPFSALQFRTEGIDVEFMSARGGMPSSFWESYSAMANTQGGTIALGVAEMPLLGVGVCPMLRSWNNPGQIPISLPTLSIQELLAPISIGLEAKMIGKKQTKPLLQPLSGTNCLYGSAGISEGQHRNPNAMHAEAKTQRIYLNAVNQLNCFDASHSHHQ